MGIGENLTPSIPYIMDSYPFPWLSAVNVGNFVTVRPCIEEDDDTISTFKIWKEQMLCLLESHDWLASSTAEWARPLPMTRSCGAEQTGLSRDGF